MCKRKKPRRDAKSDDFVCKKCGAVSKKDKKLCKPKPLKD